MQILQKQNETDRMCKKKCCILIIAGIRCAGDCPEAFLSCLKLCELGVIPVLVNTIPDAYMWDNPAIFYNERG